MPVSRRPQMPKGRTFILAERPAATSGQKAFHLAISFLLFSLILLALHTQLLGLPYFWDEQGQFIPTALDLLRHGWWVARSTLPNVHPPGLEMYLVVWYKLLGYSIPATRVAMLTVAGASLTFTFLLAIELSRETEGAPAFIPPLLLLVSPLFYTQSMMAQLDMPAMVLTVLALLLFVRNNMAGAAVACVPLVLTKETAVIVPVVFSLLLLARKDYKHAMYFVPSGLALAGWLVLLHAKTSYWLGNPGFAHYNVGYALHPVRALFSIVRRLYYVFFAEFRWIGTAILIATAHKTRAFGTEGWRVTLLVSLATLLLVSLLGGAELERYLLPVLPVFYIAVSIGICCLRRPMAIVVTAAIVLGLVINLFWNPPYPFPYENNYAMVDFVKLQQVAAEYAETRLRGHVIATAWPFSESLRNPDYGYVSHKLKSVETRDFHLASIRALPPTSFDTLIVYTRTWMPQSGVISIPFVRSFLTRFYEWERPITAEECELAGLQAQAAWSRRGQRITVYVRKTVGI
jgi:hypothetical protein